MTLYDNAFSPFARKVRMVLEHKRLVFEAIDGLTPSGHAKLAAVNPRVEVPVLVDGDLIVVNSSHIVAYLEHRYPEHPVYPADPVARVAALAWERIADTLLDAITHDVSNGGFGFPPGTRPAGLLEAARDDLASIFADLERTLADRDFLCGTLSIAELALFPQLTAVKLLDIGYDGATHPRLLACYKRLRQLDVCRADLERTQAFLRDIGANLQRPARIVWRAIASSGCSRAGSMGGSSRRSRRDASRGRGVIKGHTCCGRRAMRRQRSSSLYSAFPLPMRRARPTVARQH